MSPQSHDERKLFVQFIVVKLRSAPRQPEAGAIVLDFMHSITAGRDRQAQDKASPCATS
jgi:hypothetical protein